MRLKTRPALPSTGRRRNILRVRRSAALNGHLLAAIGPACEKGRIELKVASPIALLALQPGLHQQEAT